MGTQGQLQGLREAGGGGAGIERTAGEIGYPEAERQGRLIAGSSGSQVQGGTSSFKGSGALGEY